MSLTLEKSTGPGKATTLDDVDEVIPDIFVLQNHCQYRASAPKVRIAPHCPVVGSRRWNDRVDADGVLVAVPDPSVVSKYLTEYSSDMCGSAQVPNVQVDPS